ncbi:hypothetical protein K0M31_017361 [Melipona bicolor]|uniref:Uncharacterized protein n=1 Tax=Melipona bicolor TaxID=60889 RepID=A0AA40G533_9HYME|nr:hypothetical protein K0M31_017361 [Melipona bicolor]
MEKKRGGGGQEREGETLIRLRSACGRGAANRLASLKGPTAPGALEANEMTFKRGRIPVESGGLPENESYFTRVPAERTRWAHRTAEGGDADAREKVTKEATVLIIGVRVPYNADKRRSPAPSHARYDTIRRFCLCSGAHRLSIRVLIPAGSGLLYPCASSPHTPNPPQASARVRLLRSKRSSTKSTFSRSSHSITKLRVGVRKVRTMLEGRMGFGVVRKRERIAFMRFVSESLPRLVQTPDACCCNYPITHPSGVTHTALLNVGDR